jgi:hypothetical protein
MVMVPPGVTTVMLIVLPGCEGDGEGVGGG